MEEKGYELWKERGRISLRTCDICGAIGVFIFGWLLLLVYVRVGKSPWKFYVPMIGFLVAGMRFHFIFGIIGIALYIYAWYYIRQTIKSYQDRYNQESIP